jgi:hypothetical protein
LVVVEKFKEESMSFAKCMRWVGLALLVAVYGTGQAVAQDANATISGTVADDTGQVLPGATVTAINEANKTTRSTVTDARGDFRFPTLVPGTYTVKVEMQGFKTFERHANVLNAASVLSLNTVKLALGQLSETITVEGGGAKVNAEDSQHTGLITSNQIEQIQSKGRDVMNLLRILPGVRYNDDLDAVGDSFGSDVPNVSGQRSSWNRVTVDGMNANELSGTSKIGSSVNLDAIAEVKVLLNTYKAEYGGTGGANIQIVSKSGGTRYAGSLYYYGRRDKWNANRWENNRTIVNGEPVARPLYHFDTYGVSLGGPIPLGKSDKKLFFFGSAELPNVQRPGPLRFFYMPSERERNGDFSQSFNQGSTTARPTVVNPVTGVAYPGNVIPSAEINKSGQALLNLLPLPNSVDPSNNYNFVRQETSRNPRQNYLFRVDWKPNEKDSLYLMARNHNSRQAGSEITAGGPKWGFYDGFYQFADYGLSFGSTHIFSSNIINELGGGARTAPENFGADTDADLQRLSRSAVGFTTGQLFPQNNVLDIIPTANLGGNSGGAESVTFNWPDRFGSDNADHDWMIRDNLTWTKGVHTFKFGGFVEKVYNNEARGGTWAGSYDFRNSARTSNPFATGNTFANALTGTFQNYTETDTYRSTQNRQARFEWYAQDTWKATRRLTVDYGMRFLWFQPYHQANARTSEFVPELYVVADAPRLFTPATGGAIDPANPTVLRTPTAAFQGRFVPGSGNVANGMLTATDPRAPMGFRDNQGIHPEPRVGFAYDLTGNGKTALHFAAGLQHQGYLGGGSQGNLQGPPNFNQFDIPNSRMDTFLLAGSGFQSPGSRNGLERNAKTPSSYQAALGLSREVGWGTTIDVSYIGSVNRHLEMSENINEIPDGTKLAGRTAPVETSVRTIQVINPLTNTRYPDQWLRPYIGHTDITIRENWGTANYNALQVQINRRYIKGLQFGASYTWSKAMGLGDSDPAAIPLNVPLNTMYSPQSHNQAHNFVFNFTYDAPKVSKLFGGVAPVKILFDNWQFSGQYALVSGDWAGVTLNGTTANNISGGTQEARPIMNGKPRKSNGSPIDPDNRWFNIDAFARPADGTTGYAPRTSIQRPGVDNLDLSVFKNFPFAKKRRVQLRCEAYNVLNHTQFRDVDRTLNYDAAGNQTNTNIGLATGISNPTRTARIIVLSARLSF